MAFHVLLCGEGGGASWCWQPWVSSTCIYTCIAIPHAGGASVNQMVEGLKMLGFDVVFDTNFAADLTVRL